MSRGLAATEALPAADTHLVKIVRFRNDERAAAASDERAGPHLLREHALLAPWYVAYRLDEELERARRHDHHLALIVASAQLLPGEKLTPSVREAAAAAAINAARRYDLVGWLDAQQIIVLMPETEEAEARAAAERIRAEMWRRSTAVGGQKWNVVQIADARSSADAATFLSSLHGLGAAAA